MREIAAKQYAGVEMSVEAEEAEKRMVKMSEKFRRDGGEIYVPSEG